MVCHVCGATLPDEPDVIGRSICPACSQGVTATPPGSQPATSTAITDRPSPLAKIDPPGPARPAIAYAARTGIDLGEASDPEVENASVAIRLMQAWKESLPEVSSSYQPSGVLPLRALIAMTAGAGIGVVLSALAAVVGGILAFVGLGLFHEVMSGATVRSRWVAIAVGLLSVVAGATPVIGAGWASARATTLSGRLGKNRSVVAAQFLSVISAALGVAIAAGLLYALGRGQPEAWLSVNSQTPEFLIVYVSGAALAAAIAMGGAGHFAAGTVRADKFCEDCDLFIHGLKVKSLRLGALRAAARAARERNAEVFASLLYSRAGTDGTVELSRCPRCGKGFVEVTAHFKARWGDSEGEKTKESWLAASLELGAADMKHFPALPCDAVDTSDKRKGYG